MQHTIAELDGSQFTFLGSTYPLPLPADVMVKIHHACDSLDGVFSRGRTAMEVKIWHPSHIYSAEQALYCVTLAIL